MKACFIDINQHKYLFYYNFCVIFAVLKFITCKYILLGSYENTSFQIDNIR